MRKKEDRNKAWSIDIEWSSYWFNRNETGASQAQEMIGEIYSCVG